ncbi:hypothetical protein L227DRAFT_19709 [Lentinus tigrinus ALCF2SS1-6]|uniref:Uncharacterized protein n=1 Tax=Lentinus tigrinus ALCF2SS1-6 TaxID=1328759 RepID=A0A5C2STV9_9APHY|nr:hypothetical protein L227DRAFT_19709 [Lentinus tigrinus ALCF2SS1-6]
MGGGDLETRRRVTEIQSWSQCAHISPAHSSRHPEAPVLFSHPFLPQFLPLLRRPPGPLLRKSVLSIGSLSARSPPPTDASRPPDFLRGRVPGQRKSGASVVASGARQGSCAVRGRQHVGSRGPEGLLWQLHCAESEEPVRPAECIGIETLRLQARHLHAPLPCLALSHLQRTLSARLTHPVTGPSAVFLLGKGMPVRKHVNSSPRLHHLAPVASGSCSLTPSSLPAPTSHALRGCFFPRGGAPPDLQAA